MKNYTLGIIGAGSWGTALACIQSQNNKKVTLWHRDPTVVKNINQKHYNPKYLTSIPLPHSLKATSDLPQLIQNHDILTIAIPTQTIRPTLEPWKKLLNNKIILNLSKGIEQQSLACISQIIQQLNPKAHYAVLSGPNFALEIAQNLPAASVLACKNRILASKLQTFLNTPTLRIFRSHDVIGVELAGALKNTIAIASGITDGLKLGFNARATIINRGLIEMAKIFKHWKGAKVQTLFGLSGVGDLILTCTGPLSRNRKFGELIGQGCSLSKAQQKIGEITEGYYTTQAIYQWKTQHPQLELPIIEHLYEILFKKCSPQRALKELLSRPLQREIDFT